MYVFVSGARRANSISRVRLYREESSGGPGRRRECFIIESAQYYSNGRGVKLSSKQRPDDQRHRMSRSQAAIFIM